MESVVPVAARRPAIGSFGGALAAVPAGALGAQVIAGRLKRTGIAPSEK